MHLRIQKYDPSMDEEPYYVEGDIDFQEGMNALQALVQFRENVAPVSFDMQCGGGACGRCAMMLDGKPTMTCLVPLDDADHTFEPLAGYPIMRDLIVDKSTLMNQIATTLDRSLLEPITATTTKIEGYDASLEEVRTSLEICARCGACTAACPVHEMMPLRYVGPTVMMAHAYRCFDETDASNVLAKAVSDGMYRCTLCGTCDTICQKGIDHLNIYKILRSKVEAEGLKPSYAD